VSDYVKQAGPCVICGATGYELSMGGPTICPSCDCGPLRPSDVRKLREAYEVLLAENARLKERAERAEVERDAAVEEHNRIMAFLGDVSPKSKQAYERMKAEITSLKGDEAMLHFMVSMSFVDGQECSIGCDTLEQAVDAIAAHDHEGMSFSVELVRTQDMTEEAKRRYEARKRSDHVCGGGPCSVCGDKG
jgi:hypothetical protein